MSGDIISALSLDKESPRCRVITVKEINGCEGSFIVSSILAHQAKKKYPTLLVTFHQMFDHYHNVGLRMGYSLKNQQTTGLLKVINPAESFVRKMFESDRENFLNDTQTSIQEMVASLSKNHGSQGPVCIYVDGVTHLFDLGYSLKSINAFVRDIIQIGCDCDSSFVVFNCTVTLDEDDTCVLANLLSHMSHSVVECESLLSGRSAEVSGHLSVRHPGQRFQPERMNVLRVAPTKYHFRLFDRGVKLFAPGAAGL